MNNETVFSKDLANKKMHVTRSFDAPVDKVWRAWTESEILDKWWAPKPWRAETKSMDFSNGGLWLYAMVSPEGEKHWCRVDIKSADPGKGFSSKSGFCDEDGNLSDAAPVMHWDVEFIATATGTNVEIDITFDSEADLEKIVQMGFQQGFTMGLGNLDELLPSL